MNGEPSRWRSAFRRFCRNRGAIIGAGVLFVVVIVVIIGPLITPYDPYAQNLTEVFLPPSSKHFMGTDEFGRDVFARILCGGRLTLSAGVIAIMIAWGIGVPLGIFSGYRGGYIDEAIMRLVDIELSLPPLLLSLVIIAILGVGLQNLVIAIGVGLIPDYARTARALVLVEKEKDYVAAARAIGASSLRVMFRHILPNVVLSLIVLGTMDAAGALLSVAGFSFLGLGAQPPTPEWGTMLSVGRQYLRVAWWLSFFPGFIITIVVLSINMIGDGLRDMLDPRLSKRR